MPRKRRKNIRGGGQTGLSPELFDYYIDGDTSKISYALFRRVKDQGFLDRYWKEYKQPVLAKCKNPWFFTRKRVYSAQIITEKYISDVLDGTITACKWVKLAVKRHISDLETGHERGLYFDPEAAQHRIDFYRFCRHYKGKEWSGKIFKPEPWQVFNKWVIYGWKKENGYRRFGTSYVQVARKNGKSTDSATDGIYLSDCDNEGGAEVYTAATTLEQARIIHQASVQMIKKSKELQEQIKIQKYRIFNEEFEYLPLASDSKTLDGLHVHAALIDEMHAWPKRDLWGVIETATGARTDPLLSIVTTAGFDRHGICYEQKEYTEAILLGKIQDDAFFGIIYTLDTKKGMDGEDDLSDKWDDESCWIKANPSMSSVLTILPDMQKKLNKARFNTGDQNNFLCKHLNIWTQQEDRWIDMDLWNSNSIGEVYLC